MSPPKKFTFRRPCGIKRHGRNRFSWEKNHRVSRNLAKLLSNQHFGVGRYPKKGSFTNYVYKRRRVGGRKKLTFCQRLYHKKMSTEEGRWSKKRQNLINVVCERPRIEGEPERA